MGYFCPKKPSLCKLGLLCVSVVNDIGRTTHHRDTEGTELSTEKIYSSQDVVADGREDD